MELKDVKELLMAFDESKSSYLSVEIDNTKINKKGYNPATVTNMDDCIGCTNCATMCPDEVITVERF